MSSLCFSSGSPGMPDTVLIRPLHHHVSGPDLEPTIRTLTGCEGDYSATPASFSQRGYSVTYGRKTPEHGFKIGHTGGDSIAGSRKLLSSEDNPTQDTGSLQR